MRFRDIRIGVRINAGYAILICALICGDTAVKSSFMSRFKLAS